MKKPYKHLHIILLLPLLLSLACTLSTGNLDADNPSQTNDLMTTTPNPGSSTRSRWIPTTEGDTVSNSLPNEAGSSGDGLVMQDSLYIQDERNLITTFIFENQEHSAVEDIEYTVTASNASGTILKTETSYIDFIAAGGRIGVASNMYLDEDQVASDVNINWTYYTDASGTNETPLVFENSRYYYDSYWDRFTTVMINDSAITYSKVRVDVIALDSVGMIVGGGVTYVDFIPANEQIGISVNGLVTDDPATLEFYPRINSFYPAISDANIFEGLSTLKTGFYFNETKLGGGFLVKNNTDHVVKNSQYYVTFYEDDGSVAQAASGSIHLLWPGQTLGVSPGEVTLSEGSIPSEYYVFVLPGSATEHELTSSPLTATDVTFIDEVLYPRVNVTINNSHSQSIDNLFLTVLLFNAQDEITGGGFAYPHPITANGSVTLSVFVTNTPAEAPARVEAYPTVRNW